ncbi:hypothetical protein KY284_036133 [Solanum tuberosum]|nr:hypothetical protein KY284_036133 [Solanum tuberosum]
MMMGNAHDVKCVLRLQDVHPFVHELATRLSHALELSVQSAEFIQLPENDVREFIKFLHPVKCAIWCQKAFGSPVSFPSLIQDKVRNERSDVKGMHRIFCDLLEKSELCLKELESQLDLVNLERGEPIVRCWSRYLLILKELERISKLYNGLKEMFWEKMRKIRVALCFLIGKLSKKSTDYQWILEHKEVTHFKIRQHFALKMLQEGRHKNEELYEMLICRSRMFEDSFEYFRHASPRSLQGQLFMQFENEEATGPAVLREWFSLVGEVIFNPQNALFISCPNDGRRFFPNTASKVDPLQRSYFIFSGRMIALALLHRVAHFSRGFSDIVTDRRLRESFYRILDHEVLNWMLHGSKTTVSIEEWKEHTNYNGYKKDDPQISWFWEIVRSMSVEQRNVLLFF